ncbi:hypothetical protein [Brenneria rubrifaciens]|uniref:Uncharacterized protein n=1 Tax=Brenneria rubrifaciens TaxID=55213 RepID=A0A4P8QWS6_9GAMM|nr:hypothetical protein [Brenneria rubrifaciens]QCR07834.1 hypothetical protein EH207_04445 [Brenneria rubrifaciens]
MRQRQADADPRQCQDRNSRWYVDWRVQEKDKTHVRLTFNPYINWQTRFMSKVLAGLNRPFGAIVIIQSSKSSTL